MSTSVQGWELATARLVWWRGLRRALYGHRISPERREREGPARRQTYDAVEHVGLHLATSRGLICDSAATDRREPFRRIGRLHDVPAVSVVAAAALAFDTIVGVGIGTGLPLHVAGVCTAAAEWHDVIADIAWAGAGCGAR